MTLRRSASKDCRATGPQSVNSTRAANRAVRSTPEPASRQVATITSCDQSYVATRPPSLAALLVSSITLFRDVFGLVLRFLYDVPHTVAELVACFADERGFTMCGGCRATGGERESERDYPSQQRIVVEGVLDRSRASECSL